MKKFLALIVILFSLSSCGNNKDKNTDEENNASWTQVENNETWTQIKKEKDPEINTGEKETINNTNEGNVINSNNQNNTSEKLQNNDAVSGTSSGSADEKVLEKEVNDLLDEFIDSLDNYEK